MSSYFSPDGGLPPQTQLLTDRAVVKEAYTVIPKGVLRDIVTSNLPGWTKTRSWILARPIAGVAGEDVRSTNVFHESHSGQRPAHFALSCPHSLQT
jgi:glyoxylate utilization-related uncharacterized protein